MAVPEIVIKLHREAPSIITVDSCPQTVSSCTGEDVIVNGAFATFAAKNTFDTDDTHSRPQHTASVFSLLRGTATAKQSLELGTRVPRALLSIILCLLLLMSMTATSILLITGILAIVQLIHEGHEYVTEEQMYILLVSYIKLCVSTILVLKLLTVNIEARFIVADKQRIDNKQMIDDKQRIDDIEMTPMKTTNKQRIMDAFGMLSTILTSPEAALIDHDKDLIQGEYLFFSTSSSLTTDSSSLTSSYSLGVGDITGVGMKRLTGGNIEAIANGGAVCLPPEHLQGPIPLKASSDVSQPKEAKRDAHIPHPPATLVIEQHAHGDLIKPFQKENITCPSVNSSLCPDAYLQPSCEDQVHQLFTLVVVEAQQKVTVTPRTDQHCNEFVPLPCSKDSPEEASPLRGHKDLQQKVAGVISCPVPLSQSSSLLPHCTIAIGAIVEVEVSTAPTLPPSQAIINDKDALLHVQQELRSIVLFVRFRFHRIFWLLRTFNTDMYIGQLLVIRHTILDVVYEVKCIRHRWNQLQSQQLRIQGFLLHTNGLPSSSQRLTQLQQSSARHMSDSLLNLRPQLEHLSRLMSVLLAQLQLANNVSIQQLPPHQNQGLKAPVPPLLIGPGNVIPFQTQVEKSGSLVT